MRNGPKPDNNWYRKDRSSGRARNEKQREGVAGNEIDPLTHSPPSFIFVLYRKRECKIVQNSSESVAKSGERTYTYLGIQEWSYRMSTLFV